jgi:phenylpropionate dioxygenase-like ring-hydroxylating dioxygenase large terminal subunit
MFAGVDAVYVAGFKPLGPTTCAIRALTLVHADAVEGVDYTQAGFHITEVTRVEDNALVEVVQRGIFSSAYEPGPFNEDLEAANRVFTQVYRDVMRD